MADQPEIKVTASDALEFEPVAPKVKKSGGALKPFAYTIVAVIAGAGVWAFYGDRIVDQIKGGEREVPVIRADISPIKERPENPGGLQVPNRDKLVYNRIQSGGGELNEGSAVERLLPPPETPLPSPQQDTSAAALTPEPITPQATVDTQEAPKAPPAPPPPGPTQLTKQTIRAESALAPAPPVEPKAAVEKATLEAATKAVAAPTETENKTTAPEQHVAAAISARPSPSNTDYRVQLAAARSAEAAAKEWDRLLGKNKDLLGAFGPAVTKVDLGASKGIFYRLRVGPLKDNAAAKALCQSLAQRKVGCLVVRPGK